MLIKQIRIQAKAPVVSAVAVMLSLVVSSANAGQRDGGLEPVHAASTSSRMPLGGRAVAPAGFLDFCRRSPAQCATGDARADSLKDIYARATSLYWASVFGKEVPAAGPAATSRVSRDFRYDWSRVFQETAANRSESLTPSRAVATFAGRAAALTADEYGVQAVDASASSAVLDMTAAMSAADMADAPAALTANPVSRVVAALGKAGSALSAVLPSEPGGAPAPERPFRVVVEAPVADVDAAPPVVTLDKAGWARINEINRSVNRRIRRASDIRAFGVADFWQAPTEAGARGDCEDYVLAKREALIDAGVRADALSIAIVMTRWGESHAVLLLASDSGEFVLDNLTPWISRWDAVDYDWQERQAPGKVFDWVRMAS